MDNPDKTIRWIAWLLLVVGASVGVVFTTVGAMYFYDYLRCTNSSCYELLIGPAIASVMATPAFAFAALVLVYFIFWG